jgi:lipopolysaccharide transport system ATP-binding protein
MSRPAIEVSGLGKHYVIRHESRHDNLRDTLHHTARKLWRRFRWGTGFATEDFWALRDVSFSIQPGEVVGIIGRNGAGKSTLLKILSRITPPTTGKVTYHGRVASLLEVGTGFHRELTGRENVYLNGSILGMKRRQIVRKFDEIVAFAEVDKFIDTPVKFYSSGMYIRLAFAVAAHLDPQILLVDEVLAVGDASFQKKCLGKMGQVAKGGRTVLFVSHNMVAVQSLCNKGVLLDGGRIQLIGDAPEVTSQYLRNGQELSLSKVMDARWASMPGSDGQLISSSITDEDGRSPTLIAMSTAFCIRTEYRVTRDHVPVHLTLHLVNEQGIVAFTTTNAPLLAQTGYGDRSGCYRSVCHVPGNLLNSGLYHVKVLLVRNGNVVFFADESVLTFEVADTEPRNEGWHGKEPGVVQPALRWETEPPSEARE